ncbi:hypothetical protein ACFLZZ_00830 [Nanoarchaeota archaeon]
MRIKPLYEIAENRKRRTDKILEEITVVDALSSLEVPCIIYVPRRLGNPFGSEKRRLGEITPGAINYGNLIGKHFGLAQVGISALKYDRNYMLINNPNNKHKLFKGLNKKIIHTTVNIDRDFSTLIRSKRTKVCFYNGNVYDMKQEFLKRGYSDLKKNVLKERIESLYKRK